MCPWGKYLYTCIPANKQNRTEQRRDPWLSTKRAIILHAAMDPDMNKCNLPSILTRIDKLVPTAGCSSHEIIFFFFSPRPKLAKRIKPSVRNVAFPGKRGTFWNDNIKVQLAKNPITYGIKEVAACTEYMHVVLSSQQTLADARYIYILFVT